MQRALAESHFSALYYYIIFYKKVNIEIAIVLANNGESAAIPEGVIEVTARTWHGIRSQLPAYTHGQKFFFR